MPTQFRELLVQWGISDRYEKGMPQSGPTDRSETAVCVPGMTSLGRDALLAASCLVAAGWAAVGDCAAAMTEWSFR
jgi:hypothetical protein